MLSLSCHFLGTDASRIIVAPSVKWIISDFSCFPLLFLGSDELRSVLVSLNIYPLYADFGKQLLLWVNFGWWFPSQELSSLGFRWREIVHSSKWLTFLPATNECEESHRNDWACFVTTSCAACGCSKVEREGGRKCFTPDFTACLFLKPYSLSSICTTTSGSLASFTSSDTFIIWHF